MSRTHHTYTGRVVGQPTVHHVTSMGNAAKQFVVVTGPDLSGYHDTDRPDVDLSDYDARVLVTAGNASIGYSIGNSQYRERDHVFLIDGRGKVFGAKPVER